MMRRKSAQYDSLFVQHQVVPPAGLREICVGCGAIIDLRIAGWVVLADGSLVHGGESCWRKAMALELVRRQRVA